LRATSGGEQGDELSDPNRDLDNASRAKGEGFGFAKSRAHSLKNFERLGMNASRGGAGEFRRAALKKGKREQPADEQGGEMSGHSHNSEKFFARHGTGQILRNSWPPIKIISLDFATPFSGEIAGFGAKRSPGPRVGHVRCSL
jgi:hypothetical protein